MLTYVKNKLLNNKWMTICLLIGNILLISIAASSPMYSDAALQKMLQKELSYQEETSGLNPGDVELRGSYAEYGTTVMDYSGVDTLAQLGAEFADRSPVPVASKETELYKTDVIVKHEIESSNKFEGTFSMRIEGIEDMYSHLTLLSGSLPKNTFEDNMLEAIVSEKTMMASSLYLGETLTLTRTVDASGNPYKVTIVGVFEEKETGDPYWVIHPGKTSNYLYIDHEAFKQAFIQTEGKKQSFGVCVYVTLDYAKMRGTDVDELLALCTEYDEKTSEVFLHGFSARFLDTLHSYQAAAKRLMTTLLVLQVPVYLLLAAFILMVSSQMLETDQNEIAMIKSRGASRLQILTIYLVQSLVIALISFAVALPLGYLITQIVGSSNAFLEFVSRKRLSVRFRYTVFLFAGGAAVVGMMAMVLPALKHSKVGIVDFKRAKHRRKRPLWQILFLDVILLGISLYGLYSYQHQASFLASSLEQGGSLDPLLYMCSSMFMLGAALLFVRIFPWLIRAIYALFKRWLSPGLYASFLRMLRSGGNQHFIMIFLVLTLSLGIFSSETARTINKNAEEQIRYQNGADLIVKENWGSQQFAADDGSIYAVYIEPDYHKYNSMTGAASFTKVFRGEGYKVMGGSQDSKDTTLLAINTKEFGETAYLKDGLLDDHWYHYLNAMSQDVKGVLVSSDFRDNLGLKLGDSITYVTKGKVALTGVIYGFVDYFPGMIPPEVSETIRELNRDPNERVVMNQPVLEGSYFVIANLSYVQGKWGVEPYEIWIRNAEDSSEYIYEFAEEKGLSFVKFVDTHQDLISLKNDPVFQATNGILTVGFIVTLILCSVGFLMYWILSILSRQLQFGIFRAMGMTMREIIGMLINEQVFLSLLSIVVGAFVGKLTSDLYVPLIQTAYSTAGQMIPLSMVSSQEDIIKLYIVVGVVIVIALVILARLVQKIKIAQALKLGED